MKRKLLALLFMGIFAFGANLSAANENAGANLTDAQKAKLFSEKVKSELDSGIDPIPAVCAALQWVSGKCKTCKTATDIANCLKTEGPALVGKACNHMCGGWTCKSDTVASACKMVCCPYATDPEVKACFATAKVTCEGAPCDPECTAPQTCVNGECVTPAKCTTANCKAPKKCVNGKCVTPTPPVKCTTTNCKAPAKCVSGQCKCGTVTCPKGKTCKTVKNKPVCS